MFKQRVITAVRLLIAIVALNDTHGNLSSVLNDTRHFHTNHLQCQFHQSTVCLYQIGEYHDIAFIRGRRLFEGDNNSARLCCGWQCADERVGRPVLYVGGRPVSKHYCHARPEIGAQDGDFNTSTGRRFIWNQSLHGRLLCVISVVVVVVAIMRKTVEILLLLLLVLLLLVLHDGRCQH